MSEGTAPGRPLPPEPGCTHWPEWYRVGEDGSMWSCRKRGRWGGLGPWRRMRPTLVRVGRGGWLNLRVNLMRDDRARKARQVAVDVCVCRAWHGPRPLGHVPLHWPDPDPSNCRAENLRWAPRGTSQVGRDPQAHRAAERAERNRASRGSRAHLTGAQVLLARELAAQGQTAGDIAQALDVSRWVAELAIRGVTYRDLPGAVEIASNRARGSDVNRAKLTEGDAVEIRAARAAGESVQSIAARYGVSRPTVYQLLAGRTWRHARAPDESGTGGPERT